MKNIFGYILAMSPDTLLEDCLKDYICTGLTLGKQKIKARVAICP
jgi:hypothetical protein